MGMRGRRMALVWHSAGRDGDACQDPGSDLVHRRGGVGFAKKPEALVVVDHRHGERLIFTMAAEEILLAIIGAGTGGGTALRTGVGRAKLRALAGPAAGRALDAVADALKQHLDRHLEGDRGIERTRVRSEPLIDEVCLRQAAREAIEHPTARMVFQPIGEDRTHQLVRQVSTLIEDRLGPEAERGGEGDLLAEKRASAEVVEAKGGGKALPLGAFAGGRRPEQDDAERSGGSRGQTDLL